MTGISKRRDGWTGEKCAKCEGTGEGDGNYGRQDCNKCGGTGEEYDAKQDDRNKEEPEINLTYFR